METLRVGFVGAGSIAKVHAETLRSISDVELAAVADVAEKPLGLMAGKFAIPGTYTDYTEMIEKEKLDIVFVCSPPFTHANATLTGLRCGSHVFCEKPPAMNVGEALQMKKEADARSLRLFYGLHKRFQPNVQAARKYLDEGRLGEVYHATTHWFRRRGIPGLGSWFTTRAVAGAGALNDIGIHVFDLTHYLMGQPVPVSVTAVMHSRFGNTPEKYNYLTMWGTHVPGGVFDVEDMGAFFVRFKNGASLVVQTSWAANTDDGIEVRVMGDRGGVMIEGDQGNEVKILTEDNGFISDVHPKLKKDITRIDMLDHFISCVRNPEKEILTGGRDGVVLQLMLDAIGESARTGREVEIPDIFTD